MGIGLDVDTVIGRINSDFEELFHPAACVVQSKVCILCNRHLHINGISWILRSTLMRRHKILQCVVAVLPAIKMSATYSGPGSNTKIKAMMLSPNGYYNPSTMSFASCNVCHDDFMTNGKRPFFQWQTILYLVTLLTF